MTDPLKKAGPPATSIARSTTSNLPSRIISSWPRITASSVREVLARAAPSSIAGYGSDVEAARYVARWELGDVTGTVVVVDVLRAFTTAAYALAGGATEIWLVVGGRKVSVVGRRLG